MENTAGKARLCRPDRQNALKETICEEERCVTTQKTAVQQTILVLRSLTLIKLIAYT